MSNHVVMAIAVLVTLGALTTSVSAFPQNPIRNSSAPTHAFPNTPVDAPIATSGNNMYMAWPNNDTGHWNVFFAKSTDGGKTLKTMMISAPNKGNTIDQTTQISTFGSNVYVTWWTNKTGTLMPIFKASNDNGDTFGKAIMLNSTG